MTLRIILFFSLSMSFVPTSLAQVGTMQEAIEAAIDGEEPESIANAMFELNREIHQFVMHKDLYDPIQKYALWHTMRVVMCAIYAAAREAAVDVAGDSARIASENTALGAARNLLLWGASFDDDYDPGFEEALLAASKIVRPMIFNIARDWAQVALEDQDPTNYPAIASRVTQWVALNILLEDFDAIVSPTFDSAVDILYPFHNPFRDAQFFGLFYRERFGNADSEAMHILAPWLIHMVPLNLVGIQERLLFRSFLGGTNGLRRRPMPAPLDIPPILQAAVQVIDDILPVDVLDFADFQDPRPR